MIILFTLLGLLALAAVACGPIREPNPTERAQQTVEPARQSSTTETRPATPLSDRGGKPEKTSLRLGLPVSAATLLPIYLAAERTFAEQGLQIEVITFNGDTEAVQALASGSVDIAVPSVNGLVNLINAGQPIRGFYAGFNQADLAWVARPEIKSWAELRGRSVAVTTHGSLSDFLTRHVLRKHGLEPEREVQIVAAGGPASVLSALKAGKVDAAILSPPFKWQAEAEGFGRLGAQDTEIGEEWPKGIFASGEKFLQEHPNTLRAVLGAHVKAIRLAAAERDVAVRSLMNVLKYERPLADLAYDEVMPRFDDRGRLPTRTMPAFWQILIAAGDVKEPWPESRLLDRRFVDTFGEWAPG